MIKNEKGEIMVSVGVIISPSNRVYLAKRPEKEFKGFFEFPGGKLELGEDSSQALYRELHEELGVKKEEISSMLPFASFSEKGEINTYELLCHIVFLKHENIDNHFHLESLWCELEKAHEYQLIPTNFQILEVVKTLIKGK